MNRKILLACVAPVVVSCLTMQPAPGQNRNRQFLGGLPAAGAGTVNLPYNIADNQGNIWMIYNNGWFQQQGNNPTFSQSGMLMINGNQPTLRNNVARLDGKTGEVILENMNAPGVLVTRRVKIDKDAGVVRYIDILKNPGNAEINLNLSIQSNMNYGITTSQNVTDPKKKGQDFAWAGQTGNNRGAGFMFAGKGAKVLPSVNYQQGNNVVQATMQVKIPGGKEIAFVTLLYAANTMDAASKWALDMKESKMLSDVPKEIRKLIVNFPVNSDVTGDLELLRGDVFDVVELRGGDQVRGTLTEKSWKLQTSFGTVELPADQVVAMLSVGSIKPRQLVVTGAGEIFGGTLLNQAVALDMSNGQSVSVPLQQVTRLGYRKRTGEAEEITFDKPFVALRAGDRVVVNPPAAPIDFVTRFGPLKVDPKTLAVLSFHGEGQASHEMTLTDGSKFTGIAPVGEFDMTLGGANAAGAQSVKFPAAALARIQLTKVSDDLNDDVDPQLTLDNGDLLVGTLTGTLKLATAFDTLTLNAGELKRLAPVASDLSEGTPGSTDVQVTLWDQTSVSGQLLDTDVEFQFGSGATVRLPLALVREYNQPLPQPSANVKDKIMSVVKDLNADDWRARDRAEEQLVTMGAVVIGVLTDSRSAQPPEAQQRIDSVLKKIKKADAKPSPVSPVPMMDKE